MKPSSSLAAILQSLPALTVATATLLPAAMAADLTYYTIFTPQDILNVEEGTTISVSGSPETKDTLLAPQQYKGKQEEDWKRSSIIKDGQGELVIDTDLDMTCTFEVREGATTIRNATINNQPGVLSPNLMISGTHASLVLDNAHYINQNRNNNDSYVSGILIGGQDGDGSLTLTNGSTLCTTQGIFAGYYSWTEESGMYPTAAITHSHDTGSYVSADDQRFYSDVHTGSDTFSTNPTALTEGVRWAHGTITVEKGSVLEAGTCAYIMNATINIDGEGSVFRDAARVAMAEGEQQHTDIGCSNSAIETEINITNGGRFTTYQQLRINESTAQTATTIINVTGEGSVFEARTTDNLHPGDAIPSGTYTTRLAKIGFGDDEAPAENPTGKVVLNLREGGAATFDEVQFGKYGARVETAIDSLSRMTARQMYMYSGMRLENAGTVESELLEVDAATIINTGSMATGSFSLLSGSTFSLVGAGTMTAATDATIKAGSTTVFAVSLAQEGASPLTSTRIVLGGTADDGSSYSGALTLEDGALFELDLSGVAAGDYKDIRLVLAEGFEGALPGTDLDLLLRNTTFTGNTVESYELAYSVQDGSLILSGSMRLAPEPATATLSLLALAALAARRRRRL